MVKKDYAISKKPLWGEADWLQIFNAWRDGVLLLYPHRHEELVGYFKIVQDVFRAASNDLHNAIRFDVESRQCYASAPYRLDDRSESMLSILSQVFRRAKRTGETSTGPRPSKETGCGLLQLESQAL